MKRALPPEDQNIYHRRLPHPPSPIRITQTSALAVDLTTSKNHLLPMILNLTTYRGIKIQEHGIEL